MSALRDYGGGASVSVAVAARIRALAADGKSPSAIEIETGASIRDVAVVLERTPTPWELAEQDRLTGWAPLCMEPDEWNHWRRTNPSNPMAARPCTDCPAGFAAEMRAEGKCNGTPGWRPPADDYEEAEVGDTVSVSNVQISAPCGTCAHQEVCAIRRTLGGLEEVDVSMPKPDPALTVVLGLTVECSHYLRTSKGGRPKRELSPLQLESARASAAKMRERKAARAS